jgi:outer membrane protein assembly factor BamD (BamD/ComL family)
MKRILFPLTIALLLSSCASTLKINEDTSAAEIIQRANEAMERNRYKTAILYYEALRERNQSNIDLVITAEYHIAFIHYKQRKYEQARAEFNSVLAYYNGTDAELYPQHFKRLSEIVIQTIDEKEKHKSPFSRS